MKKIPVVLFIGLLLMGCCSQRKPIVMERVVYVYPAAGPSFDTRLWHPQTRRDSLLWSASREVMQRLRVVWTEDVPE